MRKTRHFVFVGLVLAAVVLHAQVAKYGNTPPTAQYLDPHGHQVNVWRLHVVNGAPTLTAETGTWVHVKANLSKMPPGAKFSSWLLRKDVKAKDVTKPETEILMPDRHVDIGWTWYTPHK